MKSMYEPIEWLEKARLDMYEETSKRKDILETSKTMIPHPEFALDREYNTYPEDMELF